MGNFAMVTLNCAESNYEPKYHEPIKKQTCMETNNTNKTMTQAEMSNADNVNVNMNVKSDKPKFYDLPLPGDSRLGTTNDKAYNWWLDLNEKRLNVTYCDINENDIDSLNFIMEIGRSVFTEMLHYKEMFHMKDADRSYESRLTAICLKGCIAGFAHLVLFPEMTYINHLAIAPNAQGHGLGSMLLRYVAGRSDKPITLSVMHSMDNEFDKHYMYELRRKFYRRNGFVDRTNDCHCVQIYCNACDIYVKGDVDTKSLSSVWKTITDIYEYLHSNREKDGMQWPGCDKKPKATKEVVMKYEQMEKQAKLYNGFEYQLFRDRNAVYHDSYDWMDVTFHENGKEGVKNVCDEIIVPAKFDEILYTYCYSMPLPYIVANGGKKGLVKKDGKGTVVVPCEYDLIKPIDFYAYFVAMKDGKYGLIARDGQIIIPVENEKIFFPDINFIVTTKNGKKGLFSMDYDIYINPEYDDIEYDGPDEAIKFIRNGKTFYHNIDGQVYESGTEDDSPSILLGWQVD